MVSCPQGITKELTVSPFARTLERRRGEVGIEDGGHLDHGLLHSLEYLLVPASKHSHGELIDRGLPRLPIEGDKRPLLAILITFAV